MRFPHFLLALVATEPNMAYRAPLLCWLWAHLARPAEWYRWHDWYNAGVGWSKVCKSQNSAPYFEHEQVCMQTYSRINITSPCHDRKLQEFVAWWNDTYTSSWHDGTTHTSSHRGELALGGIVCMVLLCLDVLFFYGSTNASPMIRRQALSARRLAASTLRASSVSAL